MKAVLALFEEQSAVETALQHLRDGGYGDNNTAIISKSEAGELEEVISENPEQTAAKAALIGAGTGGTLGMAGGFAAAAAPIPGFNLVAWTVLLGTVTSAVVGGYFGALLGERAAEGDEMDYKTELANGNYLLVAHIHNDDEQLVRELINRSGGYHISMHEVDEQKLAELSGAGM